MELKTRIYLAGGLSSNWQEKIIYECDKTFEFYNPREHLLSSSAEYTIWDLHFLKKSDILFAYMERDNPSGFGLTLEVGYARALDKTIILVDEKSSKDSFFQKNFEIVRSSSTIIYDNLIDGINFLKSFNRGSC
jgi:nucleoside 2-deoxyribosyltransferase